MCLPLQSIRIATLECSTFSDAQRILIKSLFFNDVTCLCQCRLQKFVKRTGDEEFVDLTVAFMNEKQEEVTGPPIRYYYGS